MPQDRRKAGNRKSGKQAYKHPIPSRNDFIDFLTETGKPLKAEPYLKAFDLKGQRMRSLLVEQLRPWCGRARLSRIGAANSA